MLILFINLAPRNPKRKGARKASPEVVSLAGLMADPVRYPACRRFSRTAGVNLRNGMPFYQAAKGSGSALTWFHRFTREMGSRHAAFASISPSNPFAPISCIEVGPDDYKGREEGSQFLGMTCVVSSRAERGIPSGPIEYWD